MYFALSLIILCIKCQPMPDFWAHINLLCNNYTWFSTPFYKYLVIWSLFGYRDFPPWDLSPIFFSNKAEPSSNFISSSWSIYLSYFFVKQDKMMYAHTYWMMCSVPPRISMIFRICFHGYSIPVQGSLNPNVVYAEVALGRWRRPFARYRDHIDGIVRELQSFVTNTSTRVVWHTIPPTPTLGRNTPLKNPVYESENQFSPCAQSYTPSLYSSSKLTKGTYS